MQSFNLWKNLKRHIQEKHDKTRQYICSYCSFKTKRNHDLKGHVERKHGKALRFIRSLLTDVVEQASKSCFGEDNEVYEESNELCGSSILDNESVDIDESEDLVSNASADETVIDNTGISSAASYLKPFSIYPAVQRQLDNMAELRAQFQLVFADEIRDKELRQIQKRKRNEKRKVERKARLHEKCEPTRRSNRIEERSSGKSTTVGLEADSGFVMEIRPDVVDVLNVQDGESRAEDATMSIDLGDSVRVTEPIPVVENAVSDCSGDGVGLGEVLSESSADTQVD